VSQLASFVKLMRPHQWTKNAFVFTGLIFSHSWGNPELLLRVIVAAIGFSLMASSVYILNDIVDREQDAKHPKKKNRPLASGSITVPVATMLGVVLAITGLGLGYWVSHLVCLILLAYSVMNLAYSFYLKHKVLLDVFVIAAGFMLRIMAGTVGVGIPPSQWLVLCGLMVTLFLGFTKRRAEIITMGDGKSSHRLVLEHYSSVLLDKMIGITASGMIMSYSLYTTSPETIRIHGTEHLIYTVPFVMYGVFRYIYLLHHQKGGTDTAHDLARDPWLLASVVGWLSSTLWLIA